MTPPPSSAVLDDKPVGDVEPPRPRKRRLLPQSSSYIMTGIIVVIGGYLIAPLVILLVLSFNTAHDIFVDDAEWGFGHWRNAFDVPGLGEALGHSFLIWGLVTAIGFPIAIVISLVLARTKIPFSHGLEFMFWVVVIFPALASTYGWIMLGSPNSGFLNVAWVKIFGGDSAGPFNIFSVGGIVWTRLMGDSIAFKVILLTPAFRAMNGAFEEAGRVSGMSGIRTMLRVTLPVMIAPISLVLALQLIKVFQGFEVEYLLGSRFNFYTFSTLIYRMIQLEPVPQYSNAVILASLTAVIIIAIIPVQRWILHRRNYTTIVSSYKPTLIELGPWKWIAVFGISLLLFLTTALPALVLIIGSFMTRVGFFNARPAWTTAHWDLVLNAPDFWEAVRTTLILSCTAGLLSPIIFSLLAYILVRTRWRGRGTLDSMIWFSAAMPGVLLGLGLLLLFLQTPGLRWLFGSMWSLILVVVFMGVTTGVNVFKGVLVQLGAELEEAARVSGFGPIQTYFRVVVPLLMPSTVLVGMLNFVAAAGTTSSIVLLASRDTRTLSILGLQYGSGVAGAGGLEAAGIISLVITAATLAIALPARYLSRRMGIQSNSSPDIGPA
jgi:iron(III) transport system permease protein